MPFFTYPRCQRLFMRGSGFWLTLVSSAEGRSHVGPRPTKLLVTREKKNPGTQGILYSQHFTFHWKLLVYHRVEGSWYRELSQIYHSARAYVLIFMLMR